MNKGLQSRTIGQNGLAYPGVQSVSNMTPKDTINPRTFNIQQRGEDPNDSQNIMTNEKLQNDMSQHTLSKQVTVSNRMENEGDSVKNYIKNLNKNQKIISKDEQNKNKVAENSLISPGSFVSGSR